MADTEDWESYLCNVDDHLSSVFVDLGLAKRAPIAALPNLSWLWIELRYPDERGLSTDREFDALCRFEDALSALISARDDLLYVGRITGQGRREFYLYGAKDLDAVVLLQPLLDAHSEYRYQTGSKSDPNWTHFVNVLYPGKRGIEQINRRRRSGP